MTDPGIIIERSFISSEGDEWIFLFHPKTAMASIKGSAVDWESYPVIDGTAFGLVMSQEELVWLSNEWKGAAASIGGVGLYLGEPTDFVVGSDYCLLSNNYCPICLLKKADFEVHHCIWSRDGGPDTRFNQLAICNSCHAVITRGSVEDRLPKNQAAFYHQLMYFGVALIQDALGGQNSRGAKQFSEQFPSVAEIMRTYMNASPDERTAEDQRLKGEARIRYQYYRDLGLGRWSWSEHESLFMHRPLSLGGEVDT